MLAVYKTFGEAREESIYRIKHMETVGDVIDLIDEMAAGNDEELAKHAKTLQGPRTRGSTTKHGLEAVPRSTPISPSVKQLPDDIEIYDFNAANLWGKLGAMPLSQALEFSNETGTPILVRDGAHGIELYLDRPPEVIADDPIEDRIYVICGLHEERPAVFTWHPGKPLDPVEKGLTAITAVKTHNG
jgi:hypothetical protein